jgi:hypothetical protein
LQMRHGRVAEMAMKRFGVAEAKSGRAKNSAPRVVLLVFAMSRAGFEPLFWCRDDGPSLRIHGHSVFVGGITTNAAAQNRRGWGAKGTEPRARRVFALLFPGSCTVWFMRPYAPFLAPLP